MKKRNKLSIYIASGTIMILCCIGSTQYFINECFWWDCAPERAFAATDLSLPDYLFPEGAIINGPRHLTDDSSIDDMLHGAHWRGGAGIFTYVVRRYATTSLAVKGFNLDKINLSKEPWRPTDELKFTTDFEDESFSACGKWSGYRCEYIARYQEFAVSINSIIDEEMTYGRFSAIAEYIDGQMAERLYSR